MTIDIIVWRHLVEDAIRSIADESMQRKAWFGFGPEVSSPSEVINGFYSDAAIENFLDRDDNGLNQQQLAAGQRLYQLMEKFMEQIPKYPKPESVIDNPQWNEIRNAASQFLDLLVDDRPPFIWPGPPDC